MLPELANAIGVGLEFRGGSNPNITSYSRVGSAYLPMTLRLLSDDGTCKELTPVFLPTRPGLSRLTIQIAKIYAAYELDDEEGNKLSPPLLIW